MLFWNLWYIAASKQTYTRMCMMQSHLSRTRVGRLLRLAPITASHWVSAVLLFIGVEGKAWLMSCFFLIKEFDNHPGCYCSLSSAPWALLDQPFNSKGSPKLITDWTYKYLPCMGRSNASLQFCCSGRNQQINPSKQIATGRTSARDAPGWAKCSTILLRISGVIGSFFIPQSTAKDSPRSC